MLAIGVPSYMPSSKKSGRGLYFVSMREAAAITSITSTCSSMGEANLREPPFEDLELGTLLGKGGYGSVYRGSYKEQRCAVKVCEICSRALTLCQISHKTWLDVLGLVGSPALLKEAQLEPSAS